MGGPKNKRYKRSWKNLLLNKQYQLSFTLLMVGVSAILMAVLGWWVNREARQATEIFLNDVKDCRVAPTSVAREANAPDAPGPPGRLDASETPEAAEPERPRAGAVELDIGEMKMVEPDGAGTDLEDGADPATTEEDDAAAAATLAAVAELPRSQWPVDADCQKVQAGKRQELLDGQRLILYVLIGVGFLMIFGLSIYGIKMTHKVAGPLHKVSLYLAKMRDGKYDTVYNLRKGDQLIDFYGHFKGAHEGVKKMQQEDLQRLKEMLEVAEAHKIADRSPELAAAIEELKEIAKRKEEGLV